jgi:hypothetical protein
VRVYFAIRLLTAGAMAVSFVAVLMGRSVPRTPAYRYDPVPYLSIMDEGAVDSRPRVLDTRTGTLSTLPLPARQNLRWGSLSPWVDGNGERHVVGWWSAFGQGGPRAAGLTNYGLARVTFPGGRLIESIADAPVPIGRPCWSPGQPQRLLYPAGDGRLYHVDFRGSDGPASEPPRIQPVSWNGLPAPLREPFVESICWPESRAFGARLLAAARFPQISGRTTRTRLCWLTLGPSGKEVTNVETISVDDAPDTNELGSTCASLCLSSDGRYSIAFQRPSDRAEPNALWLAAADASELLRARGIPSHRLRLVADRVTRVPAAFSPDGDALYAVVSPREHAPAVRRFFLGHEPAASGGTATSVVAQRPAFGAWPGAPFGREDVLTRGGEGL